MPIKIILENIEKGDLEQYLSNVQINEIEYVIEQPADLMISSRGISQLPDFTLNALPFLFSQFIPLNNETINTIINLRNNDFENVSFKENFSDTLYPLNLECFETIFQGGIIYENIYQNYIPKTEFEEYAIEHNKAMILHFNYSQMDIEKEQIMNQFAHAAFLAPDALWMAFTNYLFMIFLLEIGDYEKAMALLKQTSRRQIVNKVKGTMYLTFYKTLALSETNSKHLETIEILENDIKEFLNDKQINFDFYKTKSLFKESMGKLDLASDDLNQLLKHNDINDFDKADINLLLGDLYLKMAQHGDVSKYNDSQKAYHETLKVFTKSETPETYAHCQMNLGIIYAEMPSLDLKKHVFAGLAQSAFTEAMHIYNKFDSPYQYAMVCTNFANAMMRLLPDVDVSRFEKISFYIFEALNIRTKKEYPEERAISILSLLNLYYHRIENVEEINPLWIEEMEGMANEIKELTQNDFLVNMANETLVFVKEYSLQ